MYQDAEERRYTENSEAAQEREQYAEDHGLGPPKPQVRRYVEEPKLVERQVSIKTVYQPFAFGVRGNTYSFQLGDNSWVGFLGDVELADRCRAMNVRAGVIYNLRWKEWRSGARSLIDIEEVYDPAEDADSEIVPGSEE